MSLNALPLSLRMELAREGTDSRRKALVKVAVEPREPGRAVSGREMRYGTSVGGRFCPFLVGRGLGPRKAVLGGRELGAVLGLSTVSSLHRGIPGAGAVDSSSEVVSRDDRDSLKAERPLGRG